MAVEVLDSLRELIPLNSGAADRFDLQSRRCSGSTVDELEVRHSKRKDGIRDIIVDSHVLGHESTNAVCPRRTGRNDDKVGRRRQPEVSLSSS